MWSSSHVKVGTSEGDSEFEERFLQCFGLGDSDTTSQRVAVQRMDSNPSEAEEARGKQLKEQRKNSPW